MRLVKYRGKFAVAWGEGGSTRRVSLRTADPDEARRRFADWQRDLERIGDTVGEIMQAYLAEKEHTVLRPDRLRQAWKPLQTHFAALLPHQVNRAECRSYTALRRRGGTQDGTIKKELGTLRAALRWKDPNTPAVFELPPSPAPRDRHLTRDEYARLLAAVVRPHIRLFVLLALHTAGRQTAILELTWDRVDFGRGLIHLSAGERGKGRATVPMNDTLRAELETHREAAMSDHVVEYAGAGVKSVKRGFRQACERAGLEGVTPHTMRHTCAVWMAEERVPMSEIAQFLGHSDSRTTERIYARYSPDYLRRAAGALE